VVAGVVLAIAGGAHPSRPPAPRLVAWGRTRQARHSMAGGGSAGDAAVLSLAWCRDGVRDVGPGTAGTSGWRWTQRHRDSPGRAQASRASRFNRAQRTECSTHSGSSFSGAGAKGAPTSSISPRDDFQLAACALLLELAHADGEFSAGTGPHRGGHGAALRSRSGSGARPLALAESGGTGPSTTSYPSDPGPAGPGTAPRTGRKSCGSRPADGVEATRLYLLRKLGHLLDLAPGYLAQAKRSAVSRDEPGSA
jgi:hypothetical protein